MIQAGTVIFLYIYHGPDSTLGEIWNNMFSRKAAVKLINSETLLLTEGAAADFSTHNFIFTGTQT